MKTYKQIKFDNKHSLCIEKSKLQKVFCPYGVDGKRYYCGSWCALLGEPSSVELFDNQDSSKSETWTKIEMCKGEIITKNFKDERKL